MEREPRGNLLERTLGTPATDKVQSGDNFAHRLAMQTNWNGVTRSVDNGLVRVEPD